MEIIIVGCGKVGNALARKLIDEEHNITLVDTSAEKIEQITGELDVMGIVGNGSSVEVLSEAGTEDADVFIAVTGSDELNLLCCLFAKKLGSCHTVARVINPMYSRELEFIKQSLGFSAIINPELATAREISRLLRFPAATKIDTFADGRVDLIKFQISREHGLDGMQIKDIQQKMGCNILVCAVERDNDVKIPDGDFTLKNNDIITFLSERNDAVDFFDKLKLPTRSVRNSLIVGGGTIGYYLAKDLLEHNIKVHIVEQDMKRCEELAEMLPEATILHGDGSNRQLLLSEGLPFVESFVPLTNLDEENVILTLFARRHSNAKLVTKINRLEFDDVFDSLEIGSVIYPKYITCDFIIQHVRALENESGNNIKTLYRILDDRVEALEFTVQQPSNATDIPLSELSLKQNQLVCCITRGNKVIIPRGNDSIQLGDSVIIVTLERGLNDISEIVIG